MVSETEAWGSVPEEGSVRRRLHIQWGTGCLSSRRSSRGLSTASRSLSTSEPLPKGGLRGLSAPSLGNLEPEYMGLASLATGHEVTKIIKDKKCPKEGGQTIQRTVSDVPMGKLRHWSG